MRPLPRSGVRLGLWLLLPLAAPSLALAQPQDPLPSWNDGSVKQAILEFVDAVTREGAPTLLSLQWTAVHMKRDWKRVYPFDQAVPSAKD